MKLVSAFCNVFALSKDSVKLPVINQSAPASEAAFAVSPPLLPPPTIIVRLHDSLADLIISGDTGVCDPFSGSKYIILNP